MTSFPHLASINASPRVLKVLSDLHADAAAEGPYLNPAASLDKFVALDTDKCALVYLLLRASGARYVVEAGTSFGLSTIYLALAVGQNAAAGGAGKVIATEKEAAKAAKARENWARAGPEVEQWIELREGDLRETLKTDLAEPVDFLLLDIWTPMALPTLKLVQPHLKKGAIVVADNVDEANFKEGYRELVEYIGKPENGFKATSIPFSGGLGFYVYLGQE
ncbi:S-adenosyl-L-methionine-dependent methyltransferase [Mycena albidolilacea]|uniref:S-adenosyl-L-methionine-dependent methyltransferase n=1 Tax=Mycena albidolilacea TaxID=1033008 RepID=A0AAD7AAZ5_9AGAR|nr:S-adenosyl-L-methionine-dependent methyltransferase [Mycena albidolilacea]